ncbi:cysteine hydrolase [Aliidongia dinghuensis]|nr:cysteine hydrolase [Aliidongia dinghuensis]
MSSPPPTTRRLAVLGLATMLASSLWSLLVPSAEAATIIDEWATVQPPAVPALKPATVDPKTTALLVLDIVPQTCNAERRPRCLATLPAIHGLLERARRAGMMVGYSLVPGSTAAAVLKEAAPVGGEPTVTSSADKFLGTDLEARLRARGIKTVITVGVAAQGAVLLTAEEAALRGFEVVVPVDGVSSDSPYAEQYLAWHMLNAPGVAGHVVLTRTDLVQF